MLEYLPALAAVALVGGLAFRGTRPAFVVRVRKGQAAVRAGTATSAFVAAVGDVCAAFGVDSAEVRGVRVGPRLALRFSRRMPPAAQQRLRNWWVAYGWTPPPRRGR